jgi:RNA polymerase sigma factor (sigma-70 family)
VTLTPVDDDPAHLSDLLLIEKCIAGHEASILTLQKTHGRDLLIFLMGAGGSADEAREIVQWLWADGLVGTPERPPFFTKFTGQSPLNAWLKPVALNRLMDFKRKEEREKGRRSRIEEAAEGSAESEADAEPGELLETNLLQLMRASVELAFSRCTDEEFVMLHLRFQDDLQIREIGKMWNRDGSSISRALNRLREAISIRTLENIRAIDPWLEIKWADFMEMCQWVRPTNFGADDTAS